jgi:hypothetical protein
MTYYTRVEKRLIEWGEEKHYPGWDIPAPTGGALGRLIDEGKDERLKATRRKDAKFRKTLAKIGIKLGRRRKSDLSMPCKESRVGRMEILTEDGESFATPPDGGLGQMVDRMAKSIERSARCRQVGECLDMMPEDMRTVVRVTYGECATPMEVPREAGEAANMMGVSERTYFRRKSEMLDWLAERLGLRSAAAA